MKKLLKAIQDPSTWAISAITGAVILISIFAIGQTQDGGEVWPAVIVAFGSFGLWIATRNR